MIRLVPFPLSTAEADPEPLANLVNQKVRHKQYEYTDGQDLDFILVHVEIPIESHVLFKFSLFSLQQFQRTKS